MLLVLLLLELIQIYFFSVEYLSYPEVCKNTINYVHTDYLLTGAMCFIYITDILLF